MFTAKFWTETLERSIKSAAQAAILVLGAGQVDAITVSWGSVSSFAAGAAILSVLTSLVSAGVGPPESPSLVD